MANRSVLALAVALTLLFSMISPAIIGAGQCLCSLGEETEAGDSHPEDAAAAEAACCCAAGACEPEATVEEPFFCLAPGLSCDVHPFCCCAADNGPPPAVNQAFLTDDRRPSFTEFQFQHTLTAAFISAADRFGFQTVSTFERNLSSISPHISSTILLI